MASKLEALQAKIQQKLESGEYYEAEQLCRTMGFRLSSQKKYEEMFALFEHGIVSLSQHNQVNAAADLANLVADDYAKLHVALSDDSVERLVRIATALQIDSAVKFLLHCLKWSVKAGSHPEGEPRLHAALANCYIEKDEPALVHVHLARANRPESYASFVRSYCLSLPEDERDMALARAALQYAPGFFSDLCRMLGTMYVLCADGVSNLCSLMAAKRAHEVPALLGACADVSTPADSVLLSFVNLLCGSLQRGDGVDVLELLRAKYSRALQRDPALQQLVDRTSQLYYNAKPAGAGGLLQDLMSSLTGDAAS